MRRSKPLLCSDGAADFPFSGGVDLLKNIFHHIELFVAQYVRKMYCSKVLQTLAGELVKSETDQKENKFKNPTVNEPFLC